MQPFYYYHTLKLFVAAVPVIHKSFVVDVDFLHLHFNEFTSLKIFHNTKWSTTQDFDLLNLHIIRQYLGVYAAKNILFVLSVQSTLSIVNSYICQRPIIVIAIFVGFVMWSHIKSRNNQGILNASSP